MNKHAFLGWLRSLHVAPNLKPLCCSRALCLWPMGQHLKTLLVLIVVLSCSTRKYVSMVSYYVEKYINAISLPIGPRPGNKKRNALHKKCKSWISNVITSWAMRSILLPCREGWSETGSPLEAVMPIETSQSVQDGTLSLFNPFLRVELLLFFPDGKFASSSEF